MDSPQGSSTPLSFRGMRWNRPIPDPVVVKELVARQVHPAAAHVMASRGIRPDTLEAFMTPMIKSLLPRPETLLGMDAALDRLVRSIQDGETVWVWGDYDVDGACSTAILVRTLRAFGSHVQFRIPDRRTEGYGPNVEGIQDIKDSGAGLLVIVDAGTVAFEPLQAAQRIGLDVVVIDHHTAHATLPPAVAVVNPNRLDQPVGLGHLCAAGVVFVACVGLVGRMRALGCTDIPNLWDMLDMVALATVADVVPLMGLNRAYVRAGIRQMERTSNAGLKALLEVSGLKPPYSNARAVFGFGLGPRINAGGRIGDAASGTRLLLSQDTDEAQALAKMLHTVNTERQQIEKACREAALSRLEPTRSVIVVGDPEWHEGIVGIVAGRLKDRFGVPCFVFGGGLDGVLKGSGRSVPGFDLGGTVAAAHKSGLIVKGGGHPMAAGATMMPEKLEEFKAFVDAAYQATDAAHIGLEEAVDLSVPANLFTPAIIDGLAVLEPFGQGNMPIQVMLPNVILNKAEMRGENGQTLIIQVYDQKTRSRVKGMMFQALGTPIAEKLLASVGQNIDLLGEPNLNTWNGTTSLELKLIDARMAVPS